MDLEKIDRSSSIIKYSKTDNVLNDICSIINSARDYAFQSVNIALVERNWLIGYRIAEEELKGEGRADYGTEIIKKLSKELKEEYGKGFDSRNLYYFLNFYKTFPNILNTLCSKCLEKFCKNSKNNINFLNQSPFRILPSIFLIICC